MITRRVFEMTTTFCEQSGSGTEVAPLRVQIEPDGIRIQVGGAVLDLTHEEFARVENEVRAYERATDRAGDARLIPVRGGAA